MTPEEFQSIYPHVLAWIRETLADHANKAQTVASRGFTRLPLYFSGELLASTKFVALERLPMLLLSALGLNRFTQFERGDFDGITYLDTFFLKRHRVADERLHFHELIHVIQWRLLGPVSFLAAYGEIRLPRESVGNDGLRGSRHHFHSHQKLTWKSWSPEN